VTRRAGAAFEPVIPDFLTCSTQVPVIAFDWLGCGAERILSGFRAGARRPGRCGRPPSHAARRGGRPDPTPPRQTSLRDWLRCVPEHAFRAGSSTLTGQVELWVGQEVWIPGSASSSPVLRLRRKRLGPLCRTLLTCRSISTSSWIGVTGCVIRHACAPDRCRAEQDGVRALPAGSASSESRGAMDAVGSAAAPKTM